MKFKYKGIVSRFLCWWFGHEPDYSRQVFDSDPDVYGWHTPCARCKLWDIDYHELVTGGKHHITMQFIKYWLFRRWWPENCKTCKKRFGCGEDECVPF